MKDWRGLCKLKREGVNKMGNDLGFKICKYCGTYYSPQGTWVSINGEWICKDCYEKHQNDVVPETIHYHKEKRKKRFFFF
jgi:NMD protein affecting ribosome stability and mRNA decay